MRKVSVAVVSVVMIMLFCASVFAAEHAVQKGENLTVIARKTGCSAQELASLNELKNPDLIFAGQKISFISKQDLKNATAWSQKRIREIYPSDENSMYFGLVIKDIRTGNIRYLIDQPSGTHASIILAFSKAWEQN